MTYDELFQIVVDRHLDLLKHDTLKFRRETAPDILQRYDEKVERLYALRRELFRAILNKNTPAIQGDTASLSKINDELETTIGDVTKIAETLQNLVKFVEVVTKIVGIVTAPSIPIPSLIAATHLTHLVAPSAIEARIATSPAMELLRAESVEAPQELSAEEATVSLPIEEVLYGVELTPEKLIITVATGGCTGEESFHVDVNKGFTGQPPYLVTVYRIKSDNCKGKFEPMQIAFSREKVGLDGLVEFVLRNKIGNTSNHRLNS